MPIAARAPNPPHSLYVVLSLPIFRLARSRSLSSWRGADELTGARDGTRADGGWDRGAAPAVSFLGFLLGGDVELRVDRGRPPAFARRQLGVGARTRLITCFSKGEGWP